MKKIIAALATGTLCAMSSGLVMAAPTIEFVGEVTTNTCTPTINGNDNGVVLLNPVTPDELNAAGNVAGLTNFNIDLSGAGCSEVKSIVLNGYNVTSGGFLGNTAPTGSDAENVGLAIVDPAGASVNLKGAVNVPVTVANDKVSLGVQYVALATGATAGQVKGTVEYTVSYK